MLLLACSLVKTVAQASHDGARDFEWEIGEWSTRVRVRAPLSRAAEWIEFTGTSKVVALANHRANVVDLAVANDQRPIEGVSLRLYDPASQQWTLHFASIADGKLTPPVSGSFENGRGVFFGCDQVNGRAVLVRFVISDITANTARFVQSYSDDGGQTWVDNWIAIDTRRSGAIESGAGK
ncbi:MAG: hypothetical protein R3E77_05345 [Steroidobacteraceae bacterium]